MRRLAAAAAALRESVSDGESVGGGSGDCGVDVGRRQSVEKGEQSSKWQKKKPARVFANPRCG